MSWRDELRRVAFGDGRRLIGAAFRGVPFLVESADRSGGRRTVTHEFPHRDDPAIEDLGRKARVFSVDAYVLGADYLRQRDALLSALEDVAGPGELVHPYYGTRRAVCSSLSVRETVAEGGIARFTIEFQDVPAQVVAPSEAPDLEAAVTAAANAADAAILLEVGEAYDVRGTPAFALESIARDLTALAEDLGARLAALTEEVQELARLDADIKSMVGEAITLVRAPADAIGQLRAVIDNLAETVLTAPRRVYQAIMATYGSVEIDLVPATTTTRERERVNQAALGGALRQALLSEAARVLITASHASRDEAIADRAALISALDEQAATAGAVAYPALMALRAAVLLAVPGDGVLSRIVTTERRTAMPSLLLTYQIYGNLEREQDIIERNAVEHPGFVVGRLEVLSRA